MGKEVIKTLVKGIDIELFWCPEVSEIQNLINQGVVAIEMAEGGISFVDDFCLDHHNDLSYLPAASITALNYYGAAVKDNTSRLMVNHVDADSVVCGITMMGLIPKDILEKFNEDIAILDTDPMSVKVLDLKYGKEIQVWKNAMSSIKHSGWAYLYGIQLFIDILVNNKAYQKKFDNAAKAEAERIKIATEDLELGKYAANRTIVLINPSRVFGFDVQYGRIPTKDISKAEGWERVCVISKVAKSGAVTIGCPNKEVAEEVFGKGGLMNVFPNLPEINGKSWGGRESVGGSPRSEVIPDAMLDDVIKIIERLCSK